MARLALLLALLLLAAPAQAERRVALVIGNAAYRVQPALPNPRNDATAMARLLADELGFEVLAPVLNATLAEMDQTLERFTAAAEGADIALFFYAGHGLEMDGANLLVPVEAVLAHERDAPRQTIRLEQVRKAMRGARTQVLLLDACRNNPIAGRMIRSNPPRGIVGGLVGDEASDGVVIAYSAAPGATASDGRGPNSPFTAALLRFLPTPGEDLGLLLRDVRRAVRQETGGQDPWLSESLSGRIYLKPGPAQRLAGTATLLPEPTPARPAVPSGAWVIPQLTDPAPERPVAPGPAPTPSGAWVIPQRPAPPPQPLPPRGAPAPLSAWVIPPLPAPPAQPSGAPASQPMPKPAPSLAAGAPGSVFRDCADCPELVVIPPGRFTMGSPATEPERDPDEGPQQAITIARRFALGRYPVTVGEWRAFVTATARPDPPSCSILVNGEVVDRRGASWRNRGFPQTDQDPVVCVNRQDALDYAAWVSARSGQRYRLPTEAEWEYAARAGGTSAWWWGSDAARQCASANGADQASHPGATAAVAPCTDGFARTNPVGHFPPNGFNLHDMGGNARQWVADCYTESLDGTPADGSPRPATPGCDGLQRGGSWDDDPRELRVAFRWGVPPDLRGHDAGLRLARDLP